MIHTRRGRGSSAFPDHGRRPPFFAAAGRRRTRTSREPWPGEACRTSVVSVTKTVIISPRIELHTSGNPTSNPPRRGYKAFGASYLESGSCGEQFSHPFSQGGEGGSNPLGAACQSDR